MGQQLLQIIFSLGANKIINHQVINYISPNDGERGDIAFYGLGDFLFAIGYQLEGSDGMPMAMLEHKNETVNVNQAKSICLIN